MMNKGRDGRREGVVEKAGRRKGGKELGRLRERKGWMDRGRGGFQ